MKTDASQITAKKPCLPPVAGDQPAFQPSDLLRGVSRSFYLTLRVLPREIRPQISLAYLLARATDTIADTRAVPRAKRILGLQQLQNLSHVPELGAVADHQTLPAEKQLLERLEDCVIALGRFEEADGRRIQELLKIIVGGQIFDLQRFPGETESELVALSTDSELDQYTYMVAGCVGEFWTKMCVAHLPALRDWNVEEMCQQGIRFGKGLQLVNVLRDIPKDLRIGRCYLPVKDPQALLDPNNFDSVRKMYHEWLDRAVAHLDVGWQYTMKIPRRETRLRLACIWPIWIGLMTIARLRHGNPLDPVQRIKISRGEVYSVMARSFLVSRNDGALDRHYQALRADAARK
ncbi:MAG TPA: squalene/phytoene synthase family protein [Verrucomicrobiae bacterium]|nr:squalene/phytoene synthase family protein [Verrucomicrobiae bacterium]